MKNEEKNLLLQDLCARLPYGVKCRMSGGGFETIEEDKLTAIGLFQFVEEGLECIPYLRPLSSMTEEERKECYQLQQDTINITFYEYDEGYEKTIYLPYFRSLVDFYNSHHFDYRGLIPMGLALEAPKGMYD